MPGRADTKLALLLGTTTLIQDSVLLTPPQAAFASGLNRNTDRSIGLLQRLTVSSILSLSIFGLLLPGCGSDKQAPQQAVFWYGLSTAQGATCSSAKTYSFPDSTARDTIVGTDGVGKRAEDGSDYLVVCTVKQSSAGGAYNVNLRFGGGDVGSFTASGSLTAPAAAAAGADAVDTSGTLDVNFNTADFALQQTGCTAQVHTLVPGAVWLQNLSCSAMKDPSSPSISCQGTGGLIFENCSH
jgi:hypothetical protein